MSPYARTHHAERDGYSVATVIDSAILNDLQQAERESDVLSRLGLKPKQYYLATLHRAENTNDVARLESIFAALQQCDQTVVLPLHPRTRSVLGAGYAMSNRRLLLTDPVSYLDILLLEKHARIILTDSGGVQKKAYWLGVPCVTLRDETEWVELVEAGWNRLVGADTAAIVGTLKDIDSNALRETPEHSAAIFGDGSAADRIVQTFLTSDT